MIEQDTIKLLRECDAGIKMGVSSIEDVMEKVESKEFRDLLSRCKREHEELNLELCSLLEKYQDQGKEPNVIAKGMSKNENRNEMDGGRDRSNCGGFDDGRL